MVLFNPGGHDWGKNYNFDGYGIGYIVFAILYTLLFLAGCSYVWLHRDAPVIRMRNIPLSLASISILHVYITAVFIVYPLNGAFPCQAEFWIMSLYLPIGIGLFQAQNQQLLNVSRQQNMLAKDRQVYKPILQKAHGIGTPSYWIWRFKIWWKATSKQGQYECFVLIGIIVQFLVSLVLYNISRRMNDYGIIGQPTGPGLCRRGWEWIPSIAWQCLWNFFFGPYLIWKIRLIRDIYHWRLQTILAIVAGIPGTPLWLIGVYSDAMAPVNKYWVPAMWLVPGIMTMELTTLCFPIFHIYRHKQAAKETQRVLKEFDQKRLQGKQAEDASMTTRSTATKGSKGKMYTMEQLDACLKDPTRLEGLQVYASMSELNGENIFFLRKCHDFKHEWRIVWEKKSANHVVAKKQAFRYALDIYVNLIDAKTAKYPINIESPIYNTLEEIFGDATKLVAYRRSGSICSTPSSAVTPWDEPEDPIATVEVMESKSAKPSKRTTISMRSISFQELQNNESSEAIVTKTSEFDPTDPLYGYSVPTEFGSHTFDAAYKSIRYMVWSETWQRYMTQRKATGHFDEEAQTSS